MLRTMVLLPSEINVRQTSPLRVCSEVAENRKLLVTRCIMRVKRSG
jgi:hypothetical protein